MSQEKPTQSLKISGIQLSNMSNVQIGGLAGKNLTAIQIYRLIKKNPNNH
ncbi:MAG: hypothetical protein HC820_09370 [Hydrococcus sp. RM1_1_31]|nr:hypothetical protein [Hydrococcus sp. RM1_1_31]